MPPGSAFPGPAGLSRRFGFEHLVWDVEVRVDRLDVVQLVEILDERQEAARLAVGHLYHRLRLHRQLRGGDLDPRRGECLADAGEVGRVARDLQGVTVY